MAQPLLESRRGPRSAARSRRSRAPPRVSAAARRRPCDRASCAAAARDSGAVPRRPAPSRPLRRRDVHPAAARRCARTLLTKRQRDRPRVNSRAQAPPRDPTMAVYPAVHRASLALEGFLTNFATFASRHGLIKFIFVAALLLWILGAYKTWHSTTTTLSFLWPTFVSFFDWFCVLPIGLGSYEAHLKLSSINRSTAVCMERARDTVLVPCGHVFCSTCAALHAATACPSCRRPVASQMRIFL